MVGWKRSSLALVLSLGAAYVGCTRDFDQFEPGNGFDATSTSGGGGKGGSGGEGGCSDNTQCTDLDACTVDTCDTATGMCSNAKAPDGPVPGTDDNPGDCIDRVCEAGVEKVNPDNTETPADDMNPCTLAACVGGSPTKDFATSDTACGAGLVCDGMGSCVGCNNASQCPMAPACQTAKCDKGTCGVENDNQGDPCATGVCNGTGACVGCVDEGDCSGASEICMTEMCVLSCPDGMENGDETDVDCGGAGCPKCGDGGTCGVNGDCMSGSCSGGMCAAPACNDNIKNGAETDVDCGGPTCSKCATGDICVANTDCLSLICTGGACKAPACNDMVKNGMESDVDCGGSCPNKCGDGKMCGGAGDCASGVCTGAACQAPTCMDMVQNGMETDVDCGGAGGCPKCAVNAKCIVNSDCTSNKCAGGTCKP